ncbi:MAG: hypothetical protein KGL39_41675 [Patescibacteria group bacterium]|nr:hypothetical protein [Patescibacteria group bacterium]
MNDFNTARQRIGGLKGLMTKLGDAPGHEHKWKSMPKCPFCGAKGKAGVFAKGGVDFFKCHASGCSSGNKVMTEIGYLAARRGLGTEKPATGASPAYEEFLKLADCWEERPQKSEVRSQKSEVKKPTPRPSPLPIAPPTPQRGEGENNPAPENPLPNPVIPPESNLDVAPVVPPTETSGGGPPPTDETKSAEAETPNAGQADQKSEVGSQKSEEKPARKDACPTDAPAFEEPQGRLALEKFYAQLKLSPADEKTLWEKRGLLSANCHALGFVSNTESNLEFLERLRDDFLADDLLESGLWLPEDKKAKKEFRPNTQFHGSNQITKKPKHLRKHKDDKWIYGFPGQGWCDKCERKFKAEKCPQCRGALKFGTHLLIPYFDETGRLAKLRPHKGGAKGGTLAGANRIYVPRDPKKAPDMVETFPRVVITEGEFKAAGLWQVLGGGRDDIEDVGHPWGVCAIPGINFGNNYDLRAELDAWLQAVQCRQVVVAFDNQDKSGRPMRERHEALIWARFLACDLARSLHIKAKVLVLPTEWRDDKGKADWDGALAGMLQGKIKV